MGSAVHFNTPIQPDELLPRVDETNGASGLFAYGIAVAGDVDGIFGEGSTTDDSTRATNAPGQGVVVVTQGRCLARVNGANGDILIGSPLTLSDTQLGVLQLADTSDDFIIARALQPSIVAFDMIAVDIQRGGLVP